MTDKQTQDQTDAVEVTQADRKFLKDLANRLFLATGPDRGYDQGDTDKLTALAHRLSHQPATDAGWSSDMESVPKGPGTRYVLLSRLGGAPYVGSYISDRHSEEPKPWFTAKGRSEAFQRSYPPTHWMPIPTPPQEPS